MTVEHLPGCDLRHTSRQRCSSWQPPEPASQDTALAATTKSSSPNLAKVEKFVLFGCIVAPLAAAGALIVSFVGLFAILLALNRVGIYNVEGNPPALPAFAYPRGAVTADSWVRCAAGAHKVIVDCRNFILDSDVPFGDTQQELLAEFSSRGWTESHYRGGENGETYILSARSPANDVCVSYAARDRAWFPAEKLPRLFRIDMTVSHCSRSPG